MRLIQLVGPQFRRLFALIVINMHRAGRRRQAGIRHLYGDGNGNGAYFFNS